MRNDTDKRKSVFLLSLANQGIVAVACRACSIARSTHFRWRADDPEFVKAESVAFEEWGDLLEAEAFKRGLDGVEEPQVHQGKLTGDVVRKYDNALLFKLLQGAKPGKYREQAPGGTISIGSVKLTVVYDPPPTPLLGQSDGTIVDSTAIELPAASEDLDPEQWPNG